MIIKQGHRVKVYRAVVESTNTLKKVYSKVPVLKNIYEERELDRKATVAILETVEVKRKDLN